MITARDMAIAVAPRMAAPAVALRERILLVVLYLTVLTSSVAVIEPSPHDALMGVLAVACLVAGVRFDRLLALPLVLLLVWNVAGMSSLLRVAGDEKTIQYTGTSVYLAIAALLFACIVAQNTMPRLAAIRAAYVLTATAAAVAAIVGYFSVVPGAHELFATKGRALGAFKDPNVFGPFLIWPALIVLERIMVRRFRIMDLMIVGTLLFALLLSFSRGAWVHFAVSCAVMLTLAFLAAPTQGVRMRIFTLTVIGASALAALLVILLSLDSIGGFFQERAQLVQSYDVGQGGRFFLQEQALSTLLDFPNGMGPYAFAKVYGIQQHNQYLQAFIVYGWTGGLAYLMLIAATFWVAFRTVLVRTPWQPYLIAAFATFVGEAVEGIVIDTDHWRHFFFVLGMVWGLAAATFNQARHRHGQMPNGQMPNGQMSHVGAA